MTDRRTRVCDTPLVTFDPPASGVTGASWRRLASLASTADAVSAFGDAFGVARLGG
jgi:hypothetical protein